MTKDPGTEIEGTLHSADGHGIVRMKSRYATDIDDLWSALTDPERLARWYGKVEGDLTVGGEFTAIVAASGWKGRGRVEVCDPPRKLEVTMWEEDGDEGVVVAELTTEGDGEGTTLAIERRGIALDLTWAHGAGWHEHLEDLAAHLAAHETPDRSIGGDTRFDELVPLYREMTVVPLDR
jgi:uncharacterized protein YndB with AHSA1/START domain